jgi:hypothetical protein
MSETYEVLAVKYARHDKRTRLENFMLPDDHASIEPIDYFIWVIRNSIALKRKGVGVRLFRNR